VLIDDRARNVLKSLNLSDYPCSLERLYAAISLFLSGKITEEGFFKFLGRDTNFERNLIEYLKKLRE